jgi:hypothetical protein
MIQATFRTRRTRALCFDLESRPNAFWYDGATTAEITAFGWKWSDEGQVRTMLLQADGSFVTDDGTDVEGEVAYQRFALALESADVVYGHNIRGFDLPLLNAGLLRRQLRPLEPLRTTDTLKDLPKRKDMSASLENLAVMYGLDDDGGKKHMAIMDWEKANRLQPDGMLLARERVASDVLLQERLRDRLLDLGILREPKMWTA